MTKPTDRQKAIIKFAEDQLYFWKHTHDITSLTHMCDLKEFIHDLTDESILGTDDAKELNEILHLLYNFIRNH